jgi:hypothetical protein
VKEVLKEKKLTEAQRQQLNIRQLGRRWELTTSQYIPPSLHPTWVPSRVADPDPNPDWIWIKK